MDNLTESEFQEVFSKTKSLLREASERGSFNDMWVVCDCDDSANFKDYISRSNTQGLIDCITKLHKSLKTRKHLASIALFPSSEKEKAEREAKRRAKHMKDSKIVGKMAESADEYKVGAAIRSVERRMTEALKDTTSPESHDRRAKELEMKAKMAKPTNVKQSNAFAAEAKFHKKEAARKREINEMFQHPRNVAASQEQTLGSSTDKTMSSLRNRQDRIYQNSEHDAMAPEHEQKVRVPDGLVKMLDQRAEDALLAVERTTAPQTEERYFQTMLARALQDLSQFLASGTVADLKMASVFMSTLMSPLQYEIPTEVARFIAYGGQHEPLKKYMNSITIPKLGHVGDKPQNY